MAIKQYEKNKNQLYGILIKTSDMEYELKDEVAKLIADSIDKFKKESNQMHLISERTTRYLEDKYGGAWICVLGRKLTVNVMHEPGFYLRASTENYHVMVFKLKPPSKVIGSWIDMRQIQKQSEKEIKQTNKQKQTQIIES